MLAAMAILPLLATLALEALPVWSPPDKPVSDWLTEPVPAKTRLYRDSEGASLVLANGLVARTFRVSNFLGTTSLLHLGTGEEHVRAVRPEAFVTIDGVSHPIGGASGQPNLGFLKPTWLSTMAPLPSPIAYKGYRIGPTKPRMNWARPRHAQNRPWPPPGKRLTLSFEGSGLQVDVLYEMYDGLPALSKQVRVRNTSATPVRIDRFVLESLAFVEAESNVDETARWTLPNWTVLTDYAFGGMGSNDLNQTTSYLPDPGYTTQVNYERTMPAILEVAPRIGPGVDVSPGGEWTSFTSFLLLHDSRDRERQGLGVRRLYRTLAPWVTENPLMLHLTTVEDTKVREAIDQAAEVGFEMVILSFGSGLNMEDVSPANLAKFKALADYAKSKGLDFGGYSLLASRRISDDHDVINPKTGKTGGARFGNSPCLGSQWGIEYFRRIREFIAKTGFTILEHDGSYPGDVCASTEHPGHRGLEDSQWTQFQQIAELYRWCRERGVYLNVPDTYFFRGSNKTGMGYRETNWSLPRAQQHLHARQNLYDGTWEKPPTMGWMFVPLVEYHGGGAEATIEPLREHLDDYRQHLYNNLGYGAQACYRGPRLYDSPETKAMVQKAVDWFKSHRGILEADVVHLRRPDGRDWDGILHVDPAAKHAMAVLYNPLSQPIRRQVRLPLAHAGLADGARLKIEGGRARALKPERDGSVWVEFQIPGEGFTWAEILR